MLFYNKISQLALNFALELNKTRFPSSRILHFNENDSCERFLISRLSFDHQQASNNNSQYVMDVEHKRKLKTKLISDELSYEDFIHGI